MKKRYENGRTTFVKAHLERQEEALESGSAPPVLFVDVNKKDEILIRLTSKTIEQFKKNIIDQKYMICFAYYGDMLDVCQTRYHGNICNIGARGIVYITFNAFSPIQEAPFKYLEKIIHSFIELENPCESA